ncbi:MAG: hypothetical protein AAF941_09765 [Pseudomonadota bacterium]
MTTFGALLTVIGLLAALVARRGVGQSAGDGGAVEHLRRLFTLISLLLALRLAFLAWPKPIVVAFIMVVASWLPLVTLRLGEELVRRHASRPLKFFALGGAIGFSVLAATFGLVWAREAILALAAFQGVVILGVLAHLLAQRGSVSLVERRTADLLALAFILGLPLLATDFERLFPDLPFRGGAFAALVFVLACSRLVAQNSRPLSLFADIAITLGAGGIAALTAYLADAKPVMILLVTACAVATAALLLLIERFAAVRRSDEGILYDLARNEMTRAGILSSHPLLSTAVRLSESELADLPTDTIEKLAQSRIVSADQTEGSDALSGAVREVLNRHSATHLLRLSKQPAQFLAISGGALTEDRLTAELEIVARLLERAK